MWFLQAKGANIGDVYVATEFANHDRRIPIPVCKYLEHLFIHLFIYFYNDVGLCSLVEFRRFIVRTCQDCR